MNSQRVAHGYQRGGALILLVFFLVLAGMTALTSVLDGRDVKIGRDKKTSLALAKAEHALIGWSVSRGGAGTDRPGELPCPDIDAPGTFGYGIEEGTCVVGKVGRLPWKTLGLEELTDGYGEPLWYAIDGSFRKRWGASPSTNKPINSDTKAMMQIYASDGLNLITGAGSEVAAIVFSVGNPVNGQSRSSTNITACSVTGTNILENRCASNYLDTQNGWSNAINNGPFIRGTLTDSFNDQLIYIKASKLIAVTEKRVAKELIHILQNYYSSNGYYPYPAKYDSVGCSDVGNLGYQTDCQSDLNICMGRFPDYALPVQWGGTFVLPGWFSFNLWGQVIYYSVGNSVLNTPPVGCLNADVTLDGTSHRGIIAFPGSPLGLTIRNSTSQSLSLSDYLEDAENYDGWDTLANKDYVTPSLSTSNDKIYSLP